MRGWDAAACDAIAWLRWRLAGVLRRMPAGSCGGVRSPMTMRSDGAGDRPWPAAVEATP
ncbi:MAG: hypothetical protein KGS47_10300 [Chloroflexi bacterium]|nr:hypothetical protein [Chloroflexota bacterium]